jgi:hypothetical protein
MTFLSENSYYVTLVVILAMWFGLFRLMMSIDKKITKLEK